MSTYSFVKLTQVNNLVTPARLAKQLRLETGQDSVQTEELTDAINAAHEWVGDYVGFPLGAQTWRVDIHEETSTPIQLPYGAVVTPDEQLFIIKPTINGPKLVPVTVFDAETTINFSLAPVGMVPAACKAAVLLVAGDLYDNRSVEPVKVRTRVEKMLDFARKRVGI